MMTLYIGFGVVLLLMLVLFLLGSAGTQTENDDKARFERAIGEAPCPSQIIQRVFSKRDLEFVEGESSSQLKQMYVNERRRIAIAWIRRTSSELSSTMKEHVRAVRTRQDLQAQDELRVFGQYVGLRCLCGLMLASALVVPPSALREVATYASRLSHRLDSTQRGAVARAVPTGVRFER